MSAVVISRDEGTWLRRTVVSLRKTLPAASEVVVVDDGSIDGSAASVRWNDRVRLVRGKGLGVARARNLGARHSRGEVLVFCDAHMRFAEGWSEPMLEELGDRRVGAVAPGVASTGRPEVFGHGMIVPKPTLEAAWMKGRAKGPRAALVLPGCCTMMRREVFEREGGFDEGLRHCGGVDVETGLRLWLAGYELRVVPAARVWHRFRRRARYPALAGEVLHNYLRTALVHLKPARIGRVVRELMSQEQGGDALLLVSQSDIAARRAYLERRRLHEDDSLFRRFKLAW